MKSYTLNDGVSIPAIGLGTWQSAPQDAYKATLAAVEYGYRHIDTAYAYDNETEIGKAVKECGVKREELFITTKLPAEVKSYGGAKEHFYKSLENLGLEYIDLYLIHAPWPWKELGKDCTAGNIEVWKAFIELKAEGLVRSIGVSNFNAEQIESITGATGVKPSVNQIRFFVGNTQEPITQYCQKNGILVEAYSPLATGKLLSNAELVDIAAKCGVTLPRLCIKYCLQRGTLPLPKSVTPQRIKQNFDMNFEIPAEYMQKLNAISGLLPKPYRS